MNASNKFKLIMFFMVLTVLTVWASAGNLNPPAGTITGTMKDLNTVEPRTPISSLPFTIGVPGSYYVTRDLTGQSGILIISSDVTLDLCGFALHGVPGSGDGISISGSHSRITIQNGKVSTWDGAAINTQNAHKVTICMMHTEDNGKGTDGNGDTTVLYMMADGNRDNGIKVGDDGIIVDSSALGTTNGPGIMTGNGCKLEDCVANDNFGDGITVGEGCVVAHCTMSFNGGNGLTASSAANSRGSNITECISLNNFTNGFALAAGSTIATCTAQANSVDGISVANGCTVRNCTTRSNLSNGIEALGECTIAGNNSSVNGSTGTGAGIRVSAGPGTRVEENNCVNNGHNFDIVGQGNLLVKNSSTGGGVGGIGASGYYISAGNSFGAITTVSGSFNAGAWVNLQY